MDDASCPSAYFSAAALEHRHGSFVRYYEHNPVERRLAVLNSPSLAFLDSVSHVINKHKSGPLLLVDLGSNSGDLTLALHSLVQTVDTSRSKDWYSLGLELDPQLVDVARSACQDSTSHNVKFECCNLLVGGGERRMMEFTEMHGRTGIQIVTAFALTMWLHINAGDEGLRKALRSWGRVADVLIVEPQNWHSYKNARDRPRKRGLLPFAHWPLLSWRKTVVSDIKNFLLNECGFHSCSTCGTTVDWGREVLVFTH